MCRAYQKGYVRHHYNHHIKPMTKPLTVYKASAGSGKTFTLATEYIKLLVRNPQAYRGILAVTFTNKATGEMKMRILSQLNGIWRGYDDSRSYTQKVCQDTGLDSATVRARSGQALTLLLHNYSYFRIETIDSFFHSVLTNLARELDLTANLRLELNSDAVLEKAVDRLVEDLLPGDDVMRWIMEYIEDNISEDKGWDVIKQLKQFGKTLFKDFYQEKSEAISRNTEDDALFLNLMRRLKGDYEEADERMRSYAARFFEVLEANGLEIDDMSYGRTGVAGFFIKCDKGLTSPADLIKKRVADALEDPKKWVTRNNPRRQQIIEVVKESLFDLLDEGVHDAYRQWFKGHSARATRQYLYQLRLLGSIERKVRDINEETEQFLLSNTQHLLKSLIRESDAPFIFEKIGTQLDHIMIDEFQDTSTIQWANFKVLLGECMSHRDAENLIVGDVKQSIYRWRSGDWRLLNSIDSQFAGDGQSIEVCSLCTNYRSNGNIIEFNNAFFQELAAMEYAAFFARYLDGAEQIKKAYADVAQSIPQGKEGLGLVECCFVGKEAKTSDVLELVAAKVAELLGAGVRQSQIAMIVRTNGDIQDVAGYFLTHMPEVNIVSDVAFRLDASVAINIIIEALRLLASPSDQLARAALKKLAGGAIPEEFYAQQYELQTMPLFEIVESLYGIFGLGLMQGQSAYLCCFYDHLNHFLADQQGHIEAFLDYWETSVRSVTIQSDDAEGIRLTTIHKSKGLEFDNVLIPFCDWQIENLSSPTILWCSPGEEPYSQLPLLPIKKGRGLEGTIYEADLVEEDMQIAVDNLNLLYVALTRASHNLMVFGKQSVSKNSRSNNVARCLEEIAGKLAGSKFEKGAEDGGPLTFSYGELYVEEEAGEKHTDNVFLKVAEPLIICMETYASDALKFRQSNKSREFIEGEDADDGNYLKAGLVLHNMLSGIRTTADALEAARRLRLDGILGSDADRLADIMLKRLSSPKVADWFSGRWQLFNECSILSVDPETGDVVKRRPDRVMYDGKEMVVVDFKFGHHREEYLSQVREYMSLLRRMGYERVRGYLWFVYSNEIEEVEL